MQLGSVRFEEVRPSATAFSCSSRSRPELVIRHLTRSACDVPQIQDINQATEMTTDAEMPQLPPVEEPKEDEPKEETKAKKEERSLEEYTQATQLLAQRLKEWDGKAKKEKLPHTEAEWIKELPRIVDMADGAKPSPRLFTLYKLHEAAKWVLEQQLAKWGGKDGKAGQYPPSKFKEGAKPTRESAKMPDWIKLKVAEAAGVQEAVEADEALGVVAQPKMVKSGRFPTNALSESYLDVEKTKYELLRWLREHDFEAAKAKEEAEMRGPRQPAGAALAKKNARLAREGLTAEDDAGLKAAAVEAMRRAQQYMDNMNPEKLARNPKGSEKYNKRLSDRYDLFLEEEEYAYRRSKLAKRAGDESSDSDNEEQPPAKKRRVDEASSAAASGDAQEPPGIVDRWMEETEGAAPAAAADEERLEVAGVDYPASDPDM